MAAQRLATKACRLPSAGLVALHCLPACLPTRPCALPPFAHPSPPLPIPAPQKDEELDALRRDLARVSTERDVLREAAAPPAAPAVAAAAPHGGLTRAAPTGGPQPLRLQAGRARSGLGLGCRGSAAAPCVGQDGMQAPTLAPVVAGQPHPAAQQSPPAMVSAFADALPFSFG